jgi:acetyl-CoA C-acetyltransferase
MTDIAIVSTARTALAKSVRGSFNNTHPIVLAGHALSEPGISAELVRVMDGLR